MLIYLLMAMLALSSVWLAGPSTLKMDGWTTALVLLHLGLGLLSGPLLLWTAVRLRRREVLPARGLLSTVTCGLCSATFFTGISLVTQAARGRAASESLYTFYLAVGCSSAVSAWVLLLSTSGAGNVRRG